MLGTAINSPREFTDEQRWRIWSRVLDYVLTQPILVSQFDGARTEFTVDLRRVTDHRLPLGYVKESSNHAATC
jgi:hypothetical protein